MLKKEKVLILGVAAVQYDAIKHLNEREYETYAIAMRKDGPGADIADHFSEINFLDYEAVKNHIIDNKIDVVYSVGSDMAIPIACKLSEELELPHFISEKTARICNNKDLMRTELGQDFVGNIPFQILESVNETLTLPFPFIMKPTDSQGQRGIHLIHNIDQFKEFFDNSKDYSRTGKVICEYYVDGPEISVNGYCVDGEIKYLTASDRVTWGNYTGLIHKHQLPAQTLKEKSNEALWSIMNNLIKKIGIFNGPVYAQVKIENNTPYVIEVTPRLDGCHMWKLLDKYEGVNLMEVTFKHLLEGAPSNLIPLSHKTPCELEFICQEPRTAASYKQYAAEIEDADESYLYYSESEMVRPVNGKFEKIGYMIRECNEE